MDEQATIMHFSASMHSIAEREQTILKLHRDAIKATGFSAYGPALDKLYFDYLNDIINVDTHNQLSELTKVAKAASLEATTERARVVFDSAETAMAEEAELWRAVRAQAIRDKRAYTDLDAVARTCFLSTMETARD